MRTSSLSSPIRWGTILTLMLGAAACTEPATQSTPAPQVEAAVGVEHKGLLFRQITTGPDHTCGITTGNAAYCWGKNDHGELGNGTTTGPEDCLGNFCSTRPVRVLGGLAFRQVSAGGAFTCGVTTDNVAYCWGYNGYGVLGDGTSSIIRTRPVRVASPIP